MGSGRTREKGFNWKGAGLGGVSGRNPVLHRVLRAASPSLEMSKPGWMGLGSPWALPLLGFGLCCFKFVQIYWEVRQDLEKTVPKIADFAAVGK